jgi:thioredoxin reductase (NADPH)
VRANSLDKGMSNYLVRQIKGTPNIHVKLDAEITGGDGGELLESLSIRDRASNRLEKIPTRLLFVLIGASPYTGWVSQVVQCDAKGFIVTGHEVDRGVWPLSREPMTYETSFPGVFAVGDVRLGSMKRVASAVGEGASAVQNVHQYLEEAKGAVSGHSQHRVVRDTPETQSSH